MTLNEAEPFNCVRCGKPFGTRQMVENMLGKLGGHSMFAGGTRRLQMCGDCRVVDMVENKAEAIDLRLPRNDPPPLTFVDARGAARANLYGAARAPVLRAAGRAASPALRQRDARRRRELAAAWQELVEAAEEADPVSGARGHRDAFVGTGKAPVTLYTHSLRDQVLDRSAPGRSCAASSIGWDSARRAEIPSPKTIRGAVRSHAIRYCSAAAIARSSDLIERFITQRIFFSRCGTPLRGAFVPTANKPRVIDSRDGFRC